MARTIDYGNDSRLIVSEGPFGGDMIRAEGVLCSDGVRRNAYPTGGGIADTFYTIPARVSVKGKTVSGFVTIDGPSYAQTLGFVALSAGKNGHLLPNPWNSVYR
jgi:hypothetical protein